MQTNKMLRRNECVKLEYSTASPSPRKEPVTDSESPCEDLDHSQSRRSSYITDVEASLPVSPGATFDRRNLHDGTLDESASLTRRRDVLEDVDGGKRGMWISLEGHTHILHALYEAYVADEKNLAPVQSYTPNLLHKTMLRPGFPSKEILSVNACEIEEYLSSIMKQALTEMKYCSHSQDVEWYLSFLKTEKTDTQPPHIDFHWDKISRAHFKSSRSCRKVRYNEWRPFIAVCPLTSEGMTIEVWNARTNHDVAECEEEETGVMVHIPYGMLLLLRCDVVHAGGFMTSPLGSGNPRCHFYIYKTPYGALHDYPNSNCYNVKVGSKQVPLVTYYKHCAESAQTSNVVYQRPRKRHKG
jgi:hypothetical protein